MVARKSSSSNRKDSSEEEIVDYAATADGFFAGDSDVSEASESNDEKVEEIDDLSVDCVSDDGESNQECDDGESVDENSGDNWSHASEEKRQQDELYRQKLANAGNSVIFSGIDEPCSFDLRNLLAISSYPVESNHLYSPFSSAKANDVVLVSKNEIIHLNRGTFQVNEELLLRTATVGCSQLISALWRLPVELSEAGPMATLPLHDESGIARSLPPPSPKVETKWEKFAKAKGIGQNKEKRSAKVWDESTGEWQYRHGYKKSGNDKEWPILEVKQGDDPFQDPWEKQRDAKRKRVDKNMEQRMRNEERAGHLSKGTATRILKSISGSRKSGREGGRLDTPVGVPVDLKSPGKKGSADIDFEMRHHVLAARQRGKASTIAALRATQVSTASLGKFDKMREGEPERKNAISKAVIKKRKYENATDRTVTATETERSLKVLKSLSDGGVSKEKDRKKGRLATGETAYDYDYDDGLGASTFRKKKGRAGVGKMKKMTKKRVK